MKYDFTTVVDRRGHDAMAVEALGTWGPDAPTKEGFDVIPMWVADMNFACPSSITDAMKARLDHPFFGYFNPREEWYDCIINWQKDRNGLEIGKENIAYDNGVLGAVTSALEVFCCRGDNVLVHSPCYIGFTGVLHNNGYNAIHSELVPDENGVLRMDYEDMEKKIVENRIHAAILCSPHNPSGRVWEKWELEKASELFEKYGVSVVSDEIWSDIIMPGYKHIPTLGVSEYFHNNTVACYAPSKTFNLAGLQESYHIAFNPVIIDKMDKVSSLSHYNALNIMSMYANIGAYTEQGREWLEELRQVLGANVDYAYEYINTHFEGVKLNKPQGTYLLFADCSEWCEKHGKTLDELLKACWDVGVALQDGRGFFGKCHLRLNLALPLSRVQEAFDRLDKYVFNA